jgi:hypothetical protein
VLAAPGLARVYVSGDNVSGDNASVDVVRGIAERLGSIELAVLFAGAASVPAVEGILTLSGERAAEAAQVLSARAAPLHYEGWKHFSEGLAEIRRAFDAAGLADRLVVAEASRPIRV